MAGLLVGRLGLAEARIPHVDRHGLVWLARGRLFVEDGTLRFICAESNEMKAGDYAIPYQNVSLVLLGPGSTVSHDALRILARHGTLLAAVGEGGTKFYTAPPMGQAHSDVARKHARLWADEKARLDIARKMYAVRFGKIPPHREIAVLRGIEGARMKEIYRIQADRYRLPWEGRRYDRGRPDDADVANQAINHAATFVECAADVAVAAVGALPPLGFVHEDSNNAFTLDIADLYRAELTIPLAFKAARHCLDNPCLNLERTLRKEAAVEFRRSKLIPKMIDRIKELLSVDDAGRDAQRQ
ncbi:MAG TPA: type I-E CRISPR-associated endonuclease Cas1e [Accumulibacter sp.]|uniref:type I-E CRISPR-associated endonuclease Cas1e n=1 Tax=Accumulibacter sp. TaxID=2053492 RepID=UPI00287A9FAB|nr:type I-E CRISPR-associated endonuclease Cas1e [Accumulibacter sp.]MDS4054887.1 type I-E CRISPR-associated endonuclease Cas1e [Accumulibacter sp.]HMV06679.1 type I-E CRISPR-associated endonuclease Cas1e [Accumulibacter sp.]HMW65037.1 type I-E CRISPR-associated endonuclease Cas1e [Accumulibacter sp.]HND40495.1 type I-E CRISPR-associated endonuclease Cas1e [Accumulibacter sp.]HNE41441.1 type I-E CRISPR-associated endonuclease Cas1e [Accumulibacter sp.]